MTSTDFSMSKDTRLKRKKKKDTRKQSNNVFQVGGGSWPRILHSVKISFKIGGEIKTIPFKQRQRKLIATRVLWTWKVFLRSEEKYHLVETVTREIHSLQKPTIGYYKNHQAMPGSQIQPRTVCVNLLERSHTYSFAYCLGHFCAANAELSCERCYLALYRKRNCQVLS